MKTLSLWIYESQPYRIDQIGNANIFINFIHERQVDELECKFSNLQ